MINQTIEFECLTPCFCAGAEQSQPEIRPSAIRGSLRWWFRCLGATLEQEELAFGGVNSVKSSSVMVRVSSVNAKPFTPPKTNGQADPLAYILYYSSIAGNPDGKARFGTGSRWNDTGALGSGTTFTLHLRQLRKLPDDCIDKLQSAIDAFSHYGSIGLRVTRGLGALQAKHVNDESSSQIDERLTKNGFVIRKGRREHHDWLGFMKQAGRILKEDLRAEHGAGGVKKPASATALGSTSPVRQTSAVYLRPIKRNDRLIFAAYEAPHARVLGQASSSRHTEPVLANREFQ